MGQSKRFSPSYTPLHCSSLSCTHGLVKLCLRETSTIAYRAVRVYILEALPVVVLIGLDRGEYFTNVFTELRCDSTSNARVLQGYEVISLSLLASPRLDLGFLDWI